MKDKLQKGRIAAIFAILLVVCLTLGTACSSGGGSSSDGAAAPPAAGGSEAPADASADVGDPVTITMAHGYALDSGKGPSYQWLCDELASVSGGNITVVQEGNGSICDDSTSLDALLNGVSQFSNGILSYHAGLNPDVGPLAVPGFFAGGEDKWLEFITELQGPMEASYAKYGLKYLCPDFSSTGAMFGNGRAIVTPDDCKGLLIRSDGPYLTSALESWGASATVLGIGDLATALERGTVDYAYSGYPIVKELSMYELVDYVTFTPIGETYSGLFMTMDLWDSLSPQQQAWVEDVTTRYPKQAWDRLNANYEPYVEFCKEYGNQVTELTEEQALAFTEKTMPIFETSKATASPEGLEILKVIYKFNDWDWA